jgi:hypothetical protein
VIFYGRPTTSAIGCELNRSEFFSGPIKISWEKLHDYFMEQRAEHQRETIGEWFQWLAERPAASEATSARVAAHIAHRNWLQQ